MSEKSEYEEIALKRLSEVAATNLRPGPKGPFWSEDTVLIAISSLVAEAVAQERERAEQDAKRYRWLKEENPAALAQTAWGASREACSDEVNDKGLDAVIDAAMSAAAIRKGP